MQSSSCEASVREQLCFMKNKWIFTASFAAAVFLIGCESIPPGAERGPHRTMAYEILIEASPPGARIEANGEIVGDTPLRLKIFGDTDGSFHDFGADYYIIRALPIGTNQFAQTRYFGTGHLFGPEDRIPQRLYFDMNQPSPTYAPARSRVYVYPDYGPPPFYFGPSFYFGPGFYGPRHRRW
jgi:hypothetical protein